MNIRLQGERLTEHDGVKFKKTFICVAEGSTLRELRDFEEIHLKSTQGNVLGVCCACGFYAEVYPHFEEEEHARWEIHPRRCNVLYVPE